MVHEPPHHSEPGHSTRPKSNLRTSASLMVRSESENCPCMSQCEEGCPCPFFDCPENPNPDPTNPAMPDSAARVLSWSHFNQQNSIKWLLL